jgi:hypothetical protein
MITLEKNANIKRIYHISDIHIKKYERQDEYLLVFERLYDEIKKEYKK